MVRVKYGKQQDLGLIAYIPAVPNWQSPLLPLDRGVQAAQEWRDQYASWVGRLTTADLPRLSVAERGSVAMQLTCTPSVMAWLAGQGYDEPEQIQVAFNLAHNRKCTSEVLAIIASSSSNDALFSAVLQHPDCPSDILMRALESDTQWQRSLAMEHANIPPHIRAILNLGRV